MPNGHGQQTITHNQFGHNHTAVNAAASLIQQGGEISFIGRHQWVGLEGAPTVYTGSGHIAFRKIGATTGFNVRQENVGVESTTEADLFFAKAIRLSEKDYLGMSLNAGISSYKGNFSSLDHQDVSFRDDITDVNSVVGFGMILYRPERYYVGISLPKLVLANLGNNAERQYDVRNQYHFSAGMLFRLDDDFHIKPSMLLSYARDYDLVADASAMLYIKRMLGLGLSLRSYGDLSALAETNFSGFGIGYSYQFNPKNQPLNRKINNATHEIGVRYRFGLEKNGLL